MCFYSKLSKKAIALENRFKASIEQPELFKPSEEINAFTFPASPVIIDKAPGKILFYHWGLVPNWAKDSSIRKYTLNARIETLHEKPSFKNAINKRCLIPADGFYEWQWLDKAGKKKQKYVIELPDRGLFAFAGLYSEWIDKNTGEELLTFTIVSTKALGLMEEIHNSKKRMPLILAPEDETSWLSHKPIHDFANKVVSLVATAL